MAAEHVAPRAWDPWLLPPARRAAPRQGGRPRKPRGAKVGGVPEPEPPAGGKAPGGAGKPEGVASRGQGETGHLPFHGGRAIAHRPLFAMSPMVVRISTNTDPGEIICSINMLLSLAILILKAFATYNWN